MKNGSTIKYLPTNLREALSICESYRVGPTPGRGMRHIARRPVLDFGLRLSEENSVTGGKIGEFPILLELKEYDNLEDGMPLPSVLPLSKVNRLICRSQDELRLLQNKSFDNVSVQMLEAASFPERFGLPGDARFNVLNESKLGETGNWKYADQICGLIAAAMHAAELHPEAKKLLARIVHRGFQPAGVPELISYDLDHHNLAQAVAALMRNYHGRAGSDPFGLLDDVLGLLPETGLAPEKLHAFGQLVRGILNSDFSRKTGIIDDTGDIVLRALMFVIQRTDTAEVLADRVNGQLPGPLVYMFAAMFAGMREGLAHMPVEIKTSYATLLGELGAAAEDDPTNQTRLSEIIERSCVSKDEPNDRCDPVPEPEEKSAATLLPVCRWSQASIVRRLLAGLEKTPSNWRVVLLDDEGVALKIYHDRLEGKAVDLEDAEIQAAKQFIANCLRRVRKNHKR